ncbi:putative Beta-glucosidase 4 [Paratrimastix pyriformis]|uniref:Beta-glucosidase 4 n=1 Tax=Paratrimastix pyriformis TaxID=342808 RepID=A0ABQ8URW1_9EUKA|nr:putative Beta-glucosidase 4 [Paratrimastix pyriformis]
MVKLVLVFLALAGAALAIKWGSATASFQIEGAWLEDGKGMSIWDAFSHTPGKIVAGQPPGDVTDDFYHRYKEDVQLVKSLGHQTFRFSISWPRLMPSGRKDFINQKAVDFYRSLLNELIDNGIEPWVTLYHWDLPLALETEFGGWRHPNISLFFADYAEVCFEKFGDLVKHWITLNEPWCVAVLGHNTGEHAPGRGSHNLAQADDRVQQATEVYTVGHNLLLSHARAVQVYRTKFQAAQNGEIGITINPDFFYPLDPHDPRDKIAAERALTYAVGWWADPILFGDYPLEMRETAGSRMPTFTSEQRDLVRNSTDFLGINHYMSHLITHETDPTLAPGFYADRGGMLLEDPAWPKTDMGWSIVPSGIQDILEWIAARYGAVWPGMPIAITENGVAVNETADEAGLDDQARIAYLEGYLSHVLAAKANGVNIQAYFLWSVLDNYEWAFGMSKKFGLVRVEDGTLRRLPKASARWYTEWIKKQPQ